MRSVLIKSFNSLLLVIAFLLPIFQQIIPFLIILLILNWLILLPGNKGNFNKIQLPFYLFIGFFIMHIIGVLYSSNFDKAISDIGTKLSFLIFPLIFTFNQQLKEENIKQILIAFIFGCFIASMIDFGNIYYNILIGKYSINYMFGDYFSVLMHLGYFAMYLNFAIAATVYLWMKYRHKHLWIRILMPFIFFFISAVIVITTSKNGILMLLLLYLIFGLYYIIKFRKFILGMLLLGVSVLLLLSFMEMFPNAYIRFTNSINAFSTEEIDKQSIEGTMLRRMAWTSAGEVIDEHFWIGAGTGDVKAELKEAYAEAGFTEAYRKGINAHNQYLQTFVALGLVGVLLLLSLLLIPFYLSVVHKNYLFTLFLLINIVAALTESIFEVQAGIVFFNFFAGILFFGTQNKLTVD